MKQEVLLSKAQVLIIEDEPLNAALAVALLAIIGVSQVRVCRSGAELTQVMEARYPADLVLLDLQLPGDDGFVLCARLRAHPDFAHVPIFAVSALINPETTLRVEQGGFDGFIGKPFNFDRFPNQIRRALIGERFWEWR
ncbi:Polar-differentiation response regulator DivK [Anaerolineae bacterium]|nr:Polar-differentiation response regulator DivK [Anaerolineae bacterium]